MERLITLKQAKKLGLKHYYTGKSCKNGHVDKRQVNNRTCCACLLSTLHKHKDYYTIIEKYIVKNLNNILEN